MRTLILSFLCLAGVAAAALDFGITPDRGWKETAPGVWSISYAGKGYPGLNCRTPVKPGTFYRISCRARLAAGEQPLMVSFHGSRTNCRPAQLQAQFRERVFYWFSGPDSKLNVRFYFNPGTPARAEVEQIEIEELSAEKLSKNLLPGGDWEEPGSLTDFWRPGWGAKKLHASVAPSPGFLSGSRSLELPPAPDGRRYAVISDYMPAGAGATVELRFWGKSDRELSLTANLDCYSPTNRKGKHLYRQKQFKLDSEWQEYSLKFQLPADAASWPALSDGLARIHFGRESGTAGIIWIDNVEFLRAAAKKQE